MKNVTGNSNNFKGLMILFWICLLFPVYVFGQDIPPAKVILSDKVKSNQKVRDGFLNQMIQPLRFRENRINKDRDRILDLIKKLTESGDLRIDSVTVNKITEELLKLAKDLSQSLEENQNIQTEIKELITSLDTKAPKYLIDSVQAQLGSVLQGLVDESKKESIALRNEILKKLVAIKSVQFKCGTGKATTEEVQINDSTIVTIEKCLVTQAKVFGWHNAWTDEEVVDFYNFNYLTDIIYYGYELAADGKSKNPGDLRLLHESKLLQKTKVNKIDFSLSIYSKSPSEISAFLKNTNSQNILIENLKLLKETVPFTGLNIYFEDLAPRDKYNFSEFILKLRSAFEGKEKEFLLTISVPPIAVNNDRIKANAYDFEMLNPRVDFFLVQTNMLKLSHSGLPGSPSPLFSPEGQNNGSIQSTLAFYTNGKVFSDKLIMTVGYLGISWPVREFFENSPSLANGKYLKFNQIQDYFGQSDNFKEPAVYGFDPEQTSSYYNYVENDQFRKIWFEDGKSLYEKYSFALDQRLGGIAIWGLGYDDGYLDLWDALGAALVEIKSDTISTRTFKEEKKKTDSWYYYLDLYHDDIQWASINDIYIGDPLLGSENYCEFKHYNQKRLDSLKSFYGIDNIWILKDHSHYDSSLDPYDNYLKSEIDCVCLIERWNFFTTMHGYISLVLFGILLILITVIFLGIRRFGDDWNFRGVLTISSFVIAILMIVSILLQLFFNGHFTLFGAGSEAMSMWVLVLIMAFGIGIGIIINKIHMSRKYEYKDLP